MDKSLEIVSEEPKTDNYVMFVAAENNSIVKQAKDTVNSGC